MPKRPLVLNFSGNDSAGLAGLSMDVRTQAALGVHAAAVITANTAQNNRAVIAINPVSGAQFHSQLTAVEALPVKAVKAGLLASTEQIQIIGEFVERKQLPLVLDTVLASTSGRAFANAEFIEQLKTQLLPRACLVTPNRHEAEQLTGIKIGTAQQVIAAAETLLSYGVKAVFIKGGHWRMHESGLARDYFTDGRRSFWLSNPSIQTQYSRGTGCALSSTIASAIALGYPLYDAVVIGKMAISQALRQSYPVEDEGGQTGNTGYGPVHITHFPNESIDLPVLTTKPVSRLREYRFPQCNYPPIGLYPVVDRAHWIPTLAAVGVTTVQLRVKDLPPTELANEIQSAVQLARENHCRLFINDYWKLAIQHKAYGVHLGQEDLDGADIEKIYRGGLRLGISTHCHYEVARAHGLRPSYLACGPVYHTTTKAMPWVPQGLEGLTYWRGVVDYPLVAIGGINRQRFAAVAATGVDGIAMITAITQAENPAATAKAFIEQWQRSHKTKQEN